MGLFSFLKNAGKNLFGAKAKTAEAPVVAEVVVNEGIIKQAVLDLGLPIDKFALNLSDDVVTVYGEVENTAAKERVILVCGNVDGVCCVDDKINVANPAPEAVFYTVQSGDSLSKISKSQYGDPMKYNSIFEANKPMLSHPDKIYPGQVLRIPQLG